MRATRELTAEQFDAYREEQRRWYVSRGIGLCDCPGCAPRVRYTRTMTVRMGGLSGAHIDKALDAFALARAISFAGLNTPDRKQMGAAQTLAGEL